jgi:hypothetical protein
MSRAGVREYLPLALWLAWALFIAASSYQQILTLPWRGAGEWFQDNASLQSFTAMGRVMRGFWNGLAFPGAEEALFRALVSVGGATVVLIGAHTAGQLIFRLMRLRTDPGAERLLFTTATGLGIISFLLLTLSQFGWFAPGPVRVLLGLLAGLGLVLMGRGLLTKTRIHPPRSGHASAGPSPAGEGMGKVMTFLFGTVALVCALAPEIEYDALWYHIGLPKIWMQHGALVDLPSEFVSLYPMTWELLFGAALALGGPVAPKLLHFSCMLMCAALVQCACRRYFPGCSPWLATAFFISVPTVLWEASTAYLDLALALHLGLALYGLLRFFDTADRRWFVLSALHLGLASATKHLALFGGVILTAGLAVFLWRRWGSPIRSGLVAAGFGLLSLVPALPWYLRSFRATGNPVFPFSTGIFGAPEDRWDAAAQLGMDGFLSRFGPGDNLINLLTLPYDMTVHASRYGGSIGPLFLLLLPCLALQARRAPGKFVWVCGFVLAFFGLWVLSGNFQMRFLMPVMPFAALLAAEAYRRLWIGLAGFGRIRPAAVSGLVGLVLVLNLPPFISLQENDRLQWEGWLTHVIHHIPVEVVVGRIKQNRYLSEKIPSYAAWQEINRTLPDSAYVLTFSGGDHFYSERRRLWSNAIAARPLVWTPYADPGRNFIKARMLGITHILADYASLEQGRLGEMPILAPVELRENCEIIYADANFVLYRISHEPEGRRSWADQGRDRDSIPALQDIHFQRVDHADQSAGLGTD